MRIIAISGDGIGAGKSTLAAKLAPQVWSFAAEMRRELKTLYPAYDWFNKSQEYKDQTHVVELGKTVRQVLIDYGQEKCDADHLYWARKLADRVERTFVGQIAIDDLRKMCEIQHLRERFSDAVIHVHVVHPFAKHEPQFENADLCYAADYTIGRRLTDAELDAFTEALGMFGPVDVAADQKGDGDDEA